MKRSRPIRRSKQTPEFESLLRLSKALGVSASRMEDIFWQQQLESLVTALLKAEEDDVLNQALDQLYNSGDRGYEALADMVESVSESRSDVESAGDVMLFAAPLLAWSRYAIPSGRISPEILANLRVQLQAHVFAAGSRLGLADVLMSPDQLPQSYSETTRLRDELTKGALQNRDLHLDPQTLPETMVFLSDTRYIIGTVVVPRGAALFRWQEEDGTTEEALKRWRQQGTEVLRPLLTACATELLLPNAFYAACRDADRQSRAYAIRASVAFLSATLNLTPPQLTAVVAPFHDRHLEEYRIGFTLKGRQEVVHGVVWPLLEAEDETADCPGQIESVLKETGISEVLFLDQRFPTEYCDDCGAPLYPNPEGEPVHAELPEEGHDAPPRHFH